MLHKMELFGLRAYREFIIEGTLPRADDGSTEKQWSLLADAGLLPRKGDGFPSDASMVATNLAICQFSPAHNLAVVIYEPKGT
jgi:hypothetical protein